MLCVFASVNSQALRLDCSTVLDCWRPRSLSMACSPDQGGIRGALVPLISLPNSIMYEILDCVSSPQRSDHRWTRYENTHFAFCLFSVSWHVSILFIPCYCKAGQNTHPNRDFFMHSLYVTACGLCFMERNVATTAAARAASCLGAQSR